MLFRSINRYIQNMFTQDFLLNKISVKGEVSNCTSAIKMPVKVASPVSRLPALVIVVHFSLSFTMFPVLTIRTVVLMKRLWHNQYIEANAIDKLRNILGYNAKGIMTHYSDDNVF